MKKIKVFAAFLFACYITNLLFNGVSGESMLGKIKSYIASYTETTPTPTPTPAEDVKISVLPIENPTGSGGAPTPYTERLNESSVYVAFIDVGQGDCILIKDGDEAMLIDTGYWTEEDTVIDNLDSAGVDGIDILVLTHPDADHIGSAADLVAYYDVDIVYMPSKGKDNKVYGYLARALEEFDVQVINPSAGTLIPFGTAHYEFVGPMTDSEFDDDNSNSLILRMVNLNDSFLFTGDATGEETKKILAAGIDVHADVYKAAHHGSANDGCNSEAFMDAVNPSAMVISCGYGNDYGHPHEETMAYAKEKGLALYRTDIQGTIKCISTGHGIQWNVSPSTDYRYGRQIRKAS